MIKKKHKTLYFAKKERDKANKENVLKPYMVYRIKKAPAYKYAVLTHLQFINGFY
jgi:hypothetical protein